MYGITNHYHFVIGCPISCKFKRSFAVNDVILRRLNYLPRMWSYVTCFYFFGIIRQTGCQNIICRYFGTRRGFGFCLVNVSRAWMGNDSRNMANRWKNAVLTLFVGDTRRGKGTEQLRWWWDGKCHTSRRCLWMGRSESGEVLFIIWMRTGSIRMTLMWWNSRDVIHMVATYNNRMDSPVAMLNWMVNNEEEIVFHYQ